MINVNKKSNIISMKFIQTTMFGSRTGGVTSFKVWESTKFGGYKAQLTQPIIKWP